MTTKRIPKVGNLLTARPEGMDFETYKMLRKEQDRRLHGWNEVVALGNAHQVVHHAGRLDGVLFSPEEWVNSRENRVVIG